MAIPNDPYKQLAPEKSEEPFSWKEEPFPWKIVMYVVFAVFTVGVLIAVIYGNVSHTEPGFTTPANEWDHVPLTVSCSGYVEAEADACDTAVSVVDVINHRLGFKMLELAYGQLDVGVIADIHITMRAPVEVGSDGPCGTPGECFELTGAGTTYMHCRMQTMNSSVGASDLEWLVVYHGLGHCLGLAHDDYNQSIMRLVQYHTPDREIPPWISDWDKNILRVRYMVE